MTTPSDQPGPWGVALPEAPPEAPPNDNRSISPIALGLLAIWLGSGSALGWMNAPPGVLTFVFVVSGWILALSIHEFGHALVAHLAGDTTVEGRGYLTLNPLKYTDPVMSIVIPVFVLAVGGIGFPGGAVYLRQDLMRSRLWRSAASLAGPAGTLAVFLLLALVLAGMRALDLGGAAAAAVSVLAFLQATALILNLAPIPGLDGYGVLRPFMPEGLRNALIPIERFAALGFVLALLWLKPVSMVLFGLAGVLCHLVGVAPSEVLLGLKAFQFWT